MGTPVYGQEDSLSSSQQMPVFWWATIQNCIPGGFPNNICSRSLVAYTSEQRGLYSDARLSGHDVPLACQVENSGRK